MRKVVFAGVVLVMLASTVQAQRFGGERQRLERGSGFKERLKERLKERRAGKPAASVGGKELSYGSDPKQKLDYWRAPGGEARAPLVVFVHGGGWSIGDKAQGTGTKPQFYNGLGYAFASLNYRLVPQVTPAEQAQDIANAIATLRRYAARLGFDPDRITLMGHSAGAHLAALVSTDTRYLDKVGVPVRAITGTVLLDGAGYDVAAQMAYEGNRISGMYDAAFGKDPATHKALSPVTYTAAPNVSRWLILHVASRDDSKAQSDALARGLNAAGNSAKVMAVPGSTHMSVNKDAGVADSFVGKTIAAFLRG